MANIDLYSIAVKDNASLKIDGISKKLQSMTQSLIRQKMATQLSADALVRWEAKLAGAGPFQVMQIYQLQRQVKAHKEKQAAEAQALEATVTAQKMEAQVRSQQLQSTISSIDRAAAAQRKAQQVDMQAKVATDKLVKSLRDEAATYGMTRDQIELYRLEQSGATQAQIQSVKTAQIYRTEQIKGIAASKGLNKHLRFMRGGFGQVGHQLQDIAVQAQMGTNAMIIFGQQGSQIASLFGPHGAMIGAFLAVGAAIGSVLIPSLFGAGESMKQVKEYIDGLIDNFDNLDGALKIEALKQVQKQTKGFQEIIDDANKSIDQSRQSIEYWKSVIYDVDFAGLGKTANINEAIENIERQTIILLAAQALMGKLASKTDDVSDAAQGVIKALEEEEAALGATRTEMALYNAGVTSGSNTGKVIADIVDRIESYNKEEEALKSFRKLQEDQITATESPAEKIAREYEERIAVIREYQATENAIKEEAIAAELAAEKIKNDAIKKLNDDVAKSQLAAASSVLSSFQNQISAMAEFVEEGSALGKAFYLAQQAMAAGMAIIKGYEAAMTIRAMMPIAGEPLAAASIAMGYITAAMIAGQTLASFEGGGHIGGRSRSGGMDNKGGVLAMLHPNESVIDHTKGQSSGVTIINNIDASGAGPEVDIKIEKAMNQSSAMTVAKIQDLMSRRRFA